LSRLFLGRLWSGFRRRQRGFKRAEEEEEEEGDWVSGSRSRPISLATKFGVLVPGEPLISEQESFDPVRPLVLIWIPIWIFQNFIRALGGGWPWLGGGAYTIASTNLHFGKLTKVFPSVCNPQKNCLNQVEGLKRFFFFGGGGGGLICFFCRIDQSFAILKKFFFFFKICLDGAK
jgi:hypothetical protein